MEESGGDETPRTPFWVQSTTNVRRIDLYRRRASSLFFNSGVLIILLLLFAVLSMFFIIPSLISLTSPFLKPISVKKSWDSINLVLVLFALAFGFLGRNINNDGNNDGINDGNGVKLGSGGSGFDRSRSDLTNAGPIESPLTGNRSQWYDFPEQPISGLRRHRSTSSYPDLRELSPPWDHRVEPVWRFSDDTHLNSHRSLGSVSASASGLNYDSYYFRPVQDVFKQDLYAPPAPEQTVVAGVESRSPLVEAAEMHSQLPEVHSLLPEMHSSPPEQIRTFHSVAVDEEEKGSSLEFKRDVSPEREIPLPERETGSPENQDSEQREEIGVRKRGKGGRRRARSSEPRKMASTNDEIAAEPPSPPSISPEFQDFDRKTSKSERKRTGGNATKEFFTSFYQKKKKKRQRQRSVDNLDTLLYHSQPPVKFRLPPPSPPPPPPPPPPSILNNLFTSKKERRKKTSSSSIPPIPPSPPPPKAGRASKGGTRDPPHTRTVTRVSPFVTEKPRIPVKMGFFTNIDDSSNGGESPMSRIPPPPPMPPFKMPDWKFAVEGDYVNVQNTLSSDGDESQSPSSTVASPVFCPSPDVNTKADKFIERFRAGLKLEKINSFNQNQGNRMSNLGPRPGPSHSYRY